MAENRLKRQLLKEKLFAKNRLVIVNEDTFAELFSLRLTLMNVFVVASSAAILIVTCTTFLIAFTPLREFIPGYASTKLKKDATQLALKSDSLTVALQKNEAYIASIKQILTGNLEYAQLNKDSILATKTLEKEAVELELSPEEQMIRSLAEKEDKYNLFEKAQAKVNVVLFAPVNGSITQKYNVHKKHLAVDVAVTKNTPIKSIADGTVIFSDWTPTSGYVVVVRHNNGFISVYKNASASTKDQGDLVKTREVIALAGATSRESTGSQLHFELWKDGQPVDPTQYIAFN
ncbi:MAG: M23 family metallopeptidase [Flavobacterium sp.]|nr:M23 family metallopeptidase [Flavobacterium sp.]